MMRMRMLGRLRLSSIMWLNGCHKLAASPRPTHPDTLHSPKSTNSSVHFTHTPTLSTIHHSEIALWHALLSTEYG